MVKKSPLGLLKWKANLFIFKCLCVCSESKGRWQQPLIFPVRLPCLFTQKSRWTAWDLEYWALRTSDSAEERVSVRCPLHTTHWSKREISCDLSFAIAKCAVSKSERILCKAFSLIKSKQHGGKKKQCWSNRRSSRSYWISMMSTQTTGWKKKV